jgi:hypothetical protein
MTESRRLNVVVAALAGLCLTGCASVSVHKLDPKTGQVVAGATEGLRFYLPRPYVSVYEPFIVSSEVYIARGELSPDSTHVLLTQVPEGLSRIVGKALAEGSESGMGALRIEAGEVRVAERDPGAPQSASATAPTAPASAASAPEAGKTGISGGVLNYKATNDNSAFAVTPQPRYFNILWLPDFDEQYVVTAKAGLGNAGVVMGFGQGWSLQALEATVDNSALAKPLLDFYAGSLGALQKLATAKIEAPLGALSGQPQSASAASFQGGTPVTVKVTKVRLVAPGLYPVLKPWEAGQLELEADQAQRILAPVQPLTNVAFNTYDVVVIEAARAAGDSALRMQQYMDSPGAAPAGGGAPPRAGLPGEAAPTDAALRALRTELALPANRTRDKEYFVPTMTRNASGELEVTLTRRTDGDPGALAALPDDDALKSKVIALLKDAGVDMAESRIFIKR